jgi:hypothetical protein
VSIDTSVGRVDSVQKCPKVSKCQLTLVSKCRAGAQKTLQLGRGRTLPRTSRLGLAPAHITEPYLKLRRSQATGRGGHVPSGRYSNKIRNDKQKAAVRLQPVRVLRLRLRLRLWLWLLLRLRLRRRLRLRLHSLCLLPAQRRRAAHRQVPGGARGRARRRDAGRRAAQGLLERPQPPRVVGRAARARRARCAGAVAGTPLSGAVVSASRSTVSSTVQSKDERQPNAAPS